MLHYRWSYREPQEAFLRHAFTTGTDSAMAEKVMGRMQSYLPRLGVNELTVPLIEKSYQALLKILDTHFEQMPYLLGGHPSIADYGLIDPLFAHLGRDPVPAQIMKLQAPRVYRWVECMTALGLDVVEHLTSAPEFLPDDAIPPTLEPLLFHTAEEIFPELSDKMAFMDEWVARLQPADGERVTEKPLQRHLGLVKTQLRGAPVEVGVEPYLLYVLQRAVDTLIDLPAAEQQRVLEALRHFGLAEAVWAGRDYGVARRNNIEVWRSV